MAIAELIAIALGLLVGLSLGALGGGGSTLAVPILVFVGGMATTEATSASLIVVGVAAAVGAVGHYRHGHVKVAAGLAFGAAGVVGSYLGTRLNHALPENVLLLAFSALIVFVAIRMYRSARAGTAPLSPEEAAAAADQAHRSRAGGDRTGSLQIEDDGAIVVQRVADITRLTGAEYAKLAGAATAVGVLTGLFGVGGGFAVVPALVMFMKFNTKDAIGTSLLVIAINTAIALFMRRHGLHAFDWGLILPFVATTTLGVVVGLRAAKNIDADRLTRGFAAMLLVVAVYTAATVIVPTIT